jgi:chemotaxis protein methyltransferase WspC
MFARLLNRTIGLDAESIGISAVERAVRSRIAACRLPDAQAYWQHLRVSAAELQELVEAVVVPETCFFRHPQAFAALVAIAQAARRQQALRLLSLPCSTGEEPYSMAMALLDAGFTVDNFTIDAVDISVHALHHADRAVYRKNSFRGGHARFRERYFSATGDGYRLADAARRCVRFKQGNMFDAALPLSAATYDIIFCRNMLIYLDGATQRRAIGLLAQLLRATGVLFVGPSEAGLLAHDDVFIAEIPQAFAFRKAAAGSVVRSGGRQRAPPGDQPSGPLRAGNGPDPMERPAKDDGRAALDEIRRIADQGHLAEAGRRCEEYLRQRGPSPAAWHLIGLIREASGDRTAAAACYRKTLYLDPHHHDALVHLALLLAAQNDRAGARLLSERARRLDRGGSEASWLVG